MESSRIASILFLSFVLGISGFFPLDALSQNEGRALFREAREIQSKAVTKEGRESALRKYEEALRLFQAGGNETGIKMTLMNMAYLYGTLNEHRKALETYEQCLVLVRKDGTPKQEAVTLNNMGHAEKTLGHYERALGFFTQALEASRRADDLKHQAAALNNIADIFNLTTRYKEALDHYEQSLELKRQIGDRQGEAKTLNNMGLVFTKTGQSRRGLDTYSVALEIFRQAKNAREEAATLNNMAGVYRSFGLYQKSLDTANEAFAINKKIGNALGEANSLNLMALVSMSWGRYQQAEATLEKVLATARKIEVPRLEMSAVNNLGETFYFRGQYQKALGLTKEAAAIAKRLGDQRAEATFISNMAEIYRATGQLTKALKFHQEALEMRIAIDDKAGQSSSLSNLGEIYRDLGKVTDALKSYQESSRIRVNIGFDDKGPMARAAHLYMDVGRLTEAKILAEKSRDESVRGRLAMISGDYDDAKTSYTRLLHRGEKSGNANQLFLAYTGLGEIAELKGDLKTAASYYEKGVQLTEEMRSGLLPSERKHFFEVRIGGYYRYQPAKGLARVRMKMGNPQKSIQASELVRARAFADHLGYAGLPEKILKEEDEAVTTLAALKKGLAAEDSESESEKSAHLRDLVVAAQQQLDTVIEKLRVEYPHYAAVKYPQPFSLEQALLKPDEHVLYLDWVGDGVSVTLIRGTEILRSRYRPWPLTDLLKSLVALRVPFETFQIHQFDTSLALQIYKRLFDGILEGIPKGTGLCIIPEGPLAVIPFEALVVDGNPVWTEGRVGPYPDGVTYLGDVYQISYEKSLISMSLSRLAEQVRSRPSGGRILVLADPVFDANDTRAKSGLLAASKSPDGEALRPMDTIIKDVTGTTLEFSRAEETGLLADRLPKMFGMGSVGLTGLKATKAAFVDQFGPRLNDFRWVLFATHGVFLGDLPGVEPFLALTLVPQGTDGFLTLSDVLGLQMNADVVALTACQTGLGKYLSGEGVMSMGRAFQYAGARTVLMSLWPVAESSSVLLMERFFTHVKAGFSKSESLRRARTEIREAGYENPFYWTAFIMVGDVN